MPTVEKHRLSSIGTSYPSDLAARQAELVLDGTAKHHVALGESVRHPRQEVPWAGLVRRRRREGHVVDEHRRRVRRVGQHA